jgi:hypothetical protein
LRIGEDGVTSENHFFETDKGERFYFVKGIYEIRVFAAIVNRSSPRLLHEVKLMLSEEQAQQMHLKNDAVVFTFDPRKKEYLASLLPQPNLP